MIIPRYATIGQDCGSAQHGTILQVSTPGAPERENAGAFTLRRFLIPVPIIISSSKP